MALSVLFACLMLTLTVTHTSVCGEIVLSTAYVPTCWTGILLEDLPDDAPPEGDIILPVASFDPSDKLLITFPVLQMNTGSLDVRDSAGQVILTLHNITYEMPVEFDEYLIERRPPGLFALIDGHAANITFHYGALSDHAVVIAQVDVIKKDLTRVECKAGTSDTSPWSVPCLGGCSDGRVKDRRRVSMFEPPCIKQQQCTTWHGLSSWSGTETTHSPLVEHTDTSSLSKACHLCSTCLGGSVISPCTAHSDTVCSDDVCPALLTAPAVVSSGHPYYGIKTNSCIVEVLVPSGTFSLAVMFTRMQVVPDTDLYVRIERKHIDDYIDDVIYEHNSATYWEGDKLLMPMSAGSELASVVIDWNIYGEPTDYSSELFSGFELVVLPTINVGCAVGCSECIKNESSACVKCASGYSMSIATLTCSLKCPPGTYQVVEGREQPWCKPCRTCSVGSTPVMPCSHATNTICGPAWMVAPVVLQAEKRCGFSPQAKSTHTAVMKQALLGARLTGYTGFGGYVVSDLSIVSFAFPNNDGLNLEIPVPYVDPLRPLKSGQVVGIGPSLSLKFDTYESNAKNFEAVFYSVQYKIERDTTRIVTSAPQGKTMERPANPYPSLYNERNFFSSALGPIDDSNWKGPNRTFENVRGGYLDGVEGYFYMFGGTHSPDEDGTDMLGDLWSYELGSSVWQCLYRSLGSDTLGAPVARAGAAMTYADDMLYLYGGQTNEISLANTGNMLDDLWVFDLSKSMWRKLMTSSMPGRRAFASMVSYNGYLLLHGGSVTDASTYKYDIKNNVWSKLTTSGSKNALVGSASTLLGDKWYFVSGAKIEPNGLSETITYEYSISVLDLPTLAWTELVSGNETIGFTFGSGTFSKEEFFFSSYLGFLVPHPSTNNLVYLAGYRPNVVDFWSKMYSSYCDMNVFVIDLTAPENSGRLTNIVQHYYAPGLGEDTQPLTTGIPTGVLLPLTLTYDSMTYDVAILWGRSAEAYLYNVVIELTPSAGLELVAYPIDQYKRANYNKPRARVNAGVATSNSALYVFGGEAQANSYLNDMWVYVNGTAGDVEYCQDVTDLERCNPWLPLSVCVPVCRESACPAPRSLPALVVDDQEYGDVVYVYGGVAPDGSTRYTDLWEFDVEAKQWLYYYGAVPGATPTCTPECKLALTKDKDKVLIFTTEHGKLEVVSMDLYTYSARVVASAALPECSGTFSIATWYCKDCEDATTWIVFESMPLHTAWYDKYGSQTLSCRSLKPIPSNGTVSIGNWLTVLEYSHTTNKLDTLYSERPSVDLATYVRLRDPDIDDIDKVQDKLELTASLSAPFNRHHTTISVSVDASSLVLVGGTYDGVDDKTDDFEYTRDPYFEYGLGEDRTSLGLFEYWRFDLKTKVWTREDIAAQDKDQAGIGLGGGGSIGSSRDLLLFGSPGNDTHGSQVTLVRLADCARGFYCPPSYSGALECSAGTWSDFGSAVCQLCPDGTYSDKPGLQGKDLCIPCPGGTFSNTSGVGCAVCPANTYAQPAVVNKCVPCAAGQYCPVGSEAPIDQEKVVLGARTVLAKQYNDQETWDTMSQILTVTSIVLVVFLVIVGLAADCLPSFLSPLESLDRVFAREPERFADKASLYVHERHHRTGGGGCVTLLFFLLVFVGWLYLLCQYGLMNTTADVTTRTPDDVIDTQLFVQIFVQGVKKSVGTWDSCFGASHEFTANGAEGTELCRAACTDNGVYTIKCNSVRLTAPIALHVSLPGVQFAHAVHWSFGTVSAWSRSRFGRDPSLEMGQLDQEIYDVVSESITARPSELFQDQELDSTVQIQQVVLDDFGSVYSGNTIGAYSTAQSVGRGPDDVAISPDVGPLVLNLHLVPQSTETYTKMLVINSLYGIVSLCLGLLGGAQTFVGYGIKTVHLFVDKLKEKRPNFGHLKTKVDQEMPMFIGATTPDLTYADAIIPDDL